MSRGKGLLAGHYGILVIWSIFVLFPIYWVVITAFKTPLAVSQGSFIPWVDFKPTLDTWSYIFGETQSSPVGQAYANSLIMGVGSAVLATIFGSMAGYGLNRFRYRFFWMRNNDIAFWFISQRMLPPAAVVLAYLVLYGKLHLVDTRLGLTLAYLMFNLPLAVWIMGDFFRQVPIEIEESASLEGASPLRVFWRIVIPVVVPGLVASFLLSLMFSFNEYLMALILTNTNAVTFPVVLASQVTGDSIRFWVLSALALLNILPTVLITIVLERFLAGGLFAGAGR